MQGIYELLVAIFRFVSFVGEKVSLSFENIINEECSIALLPVHQNVYFVPLICRVANLRVGQFIHPDLVAKAQSEENRRLVSASCSRVFFKERDSITLKALLLYIFFCGDEITVILDIVVIREIF